VQKTLILDFQGWELQGEKGLKALYILLAQLMRAQGPAFRIVIIKHDAVPDLLGHALHRLSASSTGVPKEKALVVLNDRLELAVVGLSDEDEDTLRSAVSDNATVFSERFGDKFRSRASHLISFDDRSATPLFSISGLRQAVIEGIRAGLERTIMDPISGVYHSGSHRCFLIPSRAYSDGFFELRNFLNKDANTRRVTQWAKYLLQNLPISYLVTLGKAARQLGDRLAPMLPGVTQINVADPRNRYQSAQLAMLHKGGKIAILTDVIGTQASLDNVLTLCGNIEVNLILTIVDARETGVSGELLSSEKKFALKSVVRKPIRFWREDIPANYKYEDVIRVDPVSNAPIYEQPISELPIWKVQDLTTGKNAFLDEVLRSTNGIVFGHFESGSRHITYLFLMQRLVESYGPSIASEIRKNLDVQCARIKDAPAKFCVFYPERSPKVGDVAAEIAGTLNFAPVESITQREMAYPLSYPYTDSTKRYPETHGAIIFDDAATSGSTARRMIDILERRGFDHIFVYILCNRSGLSESRLLFEMKQYGRAQVHIQYLCELPIPAYYPSECPVCKRVERLRRIKEEL